MTEFVLDITLPIQSPVVSASSGGGELGIDHLFARDKTGAPIIPGTHIKGRLREALGNLKSVIELDDGELLAWFGEPSRTSREDSLSPSDVPNRGRLRFGDFTGPAPKTSFFRNRIAIDRERGAVRKGHLLSIEVPYPPGQMVGFRGQVRFLSDESEAERIRFAVKAGLRWLPALGGQRSVGFGHLSGEVSVSLTAVPHPELAPAVTGETLEITLELDAPFCVSKRRLAENLFESDTIIPGAAIKGAFATTLNQLAGRPLEQVIDDTIAEPWTSFGKCFSRIRFSHAFPCSKQRRSRPEAIPLSVVPAASGKWIDAALFDGPRLVNGRAPIFQIDWKSETWKAAKQAFGWASEPERQLRVRTAIDKATRSADEGKLFAYEMVDPSDHHWLCRVTIPDGSETAFRQRLLELLEAGLTHLGKTKAGGRVLSLDRCAPPELSQRSDHWIVTLQTPALLLESDPALNRSLIEAGILRDAYQGYWSAISEENLRLVRFFAGQQLAGGEYIMRRFRRGSPWQPFLLTCSGSVFVLESADRSKAAGQLKHWWRHGLPLSGSFVGDSWRTCPFVPENGFGEISVRPVNGSSDNLDTEGP